jgi:hypothetical protein
MWSRVRAPLPVRERDQGRGSLSLSRALRALKAVPLWRAAPFPPYQGERPSPRRLWQ